MMARKDKVVDDADTRGVEFLFRKNKVDWHQGQRRASPRPGELAVTPIDGGRRSEIEATSIIIATGSDSAPLPGVDIDEKTHRLLDRRAVARPRCRSGSSWSAAAISGSSSARCGSGSARKVTVVEFLDRITPDMDRELGTALQRVADASRASPSSSAPRWSAAKRGNDGVTLTLEPAQGGAREELDGRCRAGRDRPAALHRRARPRRRSASRVDNSGPHQGRRAISRPTSRASTRSAT